MAVIYLHLDYESYRQLEQSAREFKETTHTTTPRGFYHKSWRVKIGPDLILEFHGPLVAGDDQLPLEK